MGNKHTERQMLDALQRRYSTVNPGNGPRYAIAEHVKNGAGFNANRQADMIVMDLWPGDSRGSSLALIGHEVKCSRADWLNELKAPEKAWAFKRYMHYWYLVVADRDIVKPGELPDDWGLIVLLDNGSLRAAKKAPRLEPDPLPYTMLAPMMRAANLVGKSQGRADVVKHVPDRPCGNGCGAQIKLRADGKWEHIETATTSCVWPEGNWKRGYRPGTWRARP